MISSMISGPLRLSILACFAALGAIGITLAMVGAGMPFLVAAILASCVAGGLQYTAQRAAAPLAVRAAPAPASDALAQQLEGYRQHTAALRHDLRGVLSPALMMSDRLLNHADPGVQRAGAAVVRSIERATALLASSRDMMATEAPPAASVPDAPSAP